MACRRCSTCGISYPTSFNHCEICHEATDWINGHEPDPDWESTVEFHLASHPSVTEQGMRDWRHGELFKLGFRGAMLDLLADAHTDMQLARKLIGGGCSHETAARILI